MDETAPAIERIEDGSPHNGSPSPPSTMDNASTLPRATRADDSVIVYEASLQSTPLENSNKLTCISILIVTIVTVLSIFSFPFSLFLILFCFDTKRSCLPFRSIRESPWRLYLTKAALHYHLPNPPRRPYINHIYCVKRAYEYRIPLEDIKSVKLQKTAGNNSNNLTVQGLENVIIELKPGASGVKVPVRSYFEIWTKRETVHTVIIYSVEDATAFIDQANELISNLS